MNRQRLLTGLAVLLWAGALLAGWSAGFTGAIDQIGSLTANTPFTVMGNKTGNAGPAMVIANATGLSGSVPLLTIRSGSGGTTNRFSITSGGDIVTEGNIARDDGGALVLGLTNTSEIQIRPPLDLWGTIISPVGGAADIVGRAALVNGTKTVSTTSVTASSVIQLTNCAPAGTGLGILTVGTIVPGTSFVINSEVAATLAVQTLDTSTVCWSFVN